MSHYTAQATTIARAAGALLREHFGRVAIEYKGAVDLVTAADRASEKLIVERLRASFPDHDLVAEEGSRHETGSDYRWYIDPLDGTTNFAHNLPVFAVSLGLEYQGRLIAGVVYNPAQDELFAAEAGAGATLNGRPIHASSVSRLGEALLGTGFPVHQRGANPNLLFYHAITLNSHGARRYGSAALDLCYVAMGRFDGFWEFNLKPWDVAAGMLILAEAGGRATDMRGQPAKPGGPHLLGTNGRIHEEVVALFAPIFEQLAAGRLTDDVILAQVAPAGAR